MCMYPETFYNNQTLFETSIIDIYQPKVIGMMWSMLAQEQTWFGNEPWKSYGIQVRVFEIQNNF